MVVPSRLNRPSRTANSPIDNLNIRSHVCKAMQASYEPPKSASCIHRSASSKTPVLDKQPYADSGGFHDVYPLAGTQHVLLLLWKAFHGRAVADLFCPNPSGAPHHVSVSLREFGLQTTRRKAVSCLQSKPNCTENSITGTDDYDLDEALLGCVFGRRMKTCCQLYSRKNHP